MSARPQKRKPWFHAPSGFWCAQIAGKRHYLDRDPGVAQRKLNKLLQEDHRPRIAAPPVGGLQAQGVGQSQAGEPRQAGLQEPAPRADAEQVGPGGRSGLPALC